MDKLAVKTLGIRSLLDDDLGPVPALSNITQRNVAFIKDRGVREEQEETNERQSRLFDAYEREAQESGRKVNRTRND